MAMFENIGVFFKRFMQNDRKELLVENTALQSKETAKDRLHVVLMQDRANVSADFLEMMKEEIIEVIKKYIVIDETKIDVRLTNEENEDGSIGVPLLHANIPILNIRNDLKGEYMNTVSAIDDSTVIEKSDDKTQIIQLIKEDDIESEKKVGLNEEKKEHVDKENKEFSDEIQELESTEIERFGENIEEITEQFDKVEGIEIIEELEEETKGSVSDKEENENSNSENKIEANIEDEIKIEAFEENDKELENQIEDKVDELEDEYDDDDVTFDDLLKAAEEEEERLKQLQENKENKEEEKKINKQTNQKKNKTSKTKKNK